MSERLLLLVVLGKVKFFWTWAFCYLNLFAVHETQVPLPFSLRGQCYLKPTHNISMFMGASLRSCLVISLLVWSMRDCSLKYLVQRSRAVSLCIKYSLGPWVEKGDRMNLFLSETGAFNCDIRKLWLGSYCSERIKHKIILQFL